MWDKSLPNDDGLLINAPSQLRANWQALEDLTNAALQITNAKVAPGAGIVDSKLATISTAGKVQGDALTLLGNTPSGAGTLPDVNSPHKLAADASDTTPQYLDSLIDTSVFQVSAGDLLQLADNGVATEKLESGGASPGNNKAYGTNSSGVKGFYSVCDLATNQTLTGVKTMNNLKLGGNLECNDKEMKNMIIENRINDTGMTVAGQIWFRTDV